MHAQFLFSTPHGPCNIWLITRSCNSRYLSLSGISAEMTRSYASGVVNLLFDFMMSRKCSCSNPFFGTRSHGCMLQLHQNTFFIIRSFRSRNFALYTVNQFWPILWFLPRLKIACYLFLVGIACHGDEVIQLSKMLHNSHSIEEPLLHVSIAS
jgi:hypothetical protein